MHIYIMENGIHVPLQEGSSPGNSDSRLKKLLKQFYVHQEERVRTYKLFDEVFKAYLIDAPKGDFPTYRLHINEVTVKFNNLSQEIRDIETSLRDNGKLNLADIIRKVQLQEKEKLELTAKLQLTEQNCVAHHEHDISAEKPNMKSSLQTTIQNINELMEELKYEAEDILLEDEEEMDEDA